MRLRERARHGIRIANKHAGQYLSIGDGDKGERRYGGGGRGREICLSLHCHHQNDSCIKVGSDG